jgi:hypothetical protein
LNTKGDPDAISALVEESPMTDFHDILSAILDVGPPDGKAVSLE